MWSPSAKLERRLLKPALFVLCLLPSLLLLIGLIRSELGVNPVEVLTHETGQWGLRFLLVTLAVTPLRNLTNMPWLTRFRRMLGLFAFFYAVLHFFVYFLLDQSLNLRYVFEDILERPYITLGFAALCLLVPLAVTSTSKIRRRMGRKWNLLHRLVYVTTALAILHFVWLVKADYREPLIYGSIFLVLILMRYKTWTRLFSNKASANTRVS